MPAQYRPSRDRRSLFGCIRCLPSRRWTWYKLTYVWSLLLSASIIFYVTDKPRDYTSPSGRLVEYGNCTPRRNVVFLKVHKCASSTIGNIFVRRGLFTDGSTFGLPKQDPAHIGWPNSILPKHILRPRNRSPNMMFHHFIYNRSTLHSIMPRDTVYISMIREPYSQFESILHYFREVKQLDLKSYDRTQEFLGNPRKYEKKVRMYIKVSPPAYFSLTKNMMSIEFGLLEQDQDNVTKIHEFVDRINKEFSLVLIYEYFVESVILLRRFLCWRFKDVLFRSVNFRFKYDNYGGRLDRQRYENWSKADHILYKSLNASFWVKVGSQAEDFQDEVGHFRVVSDQLNRYCRSVDGKLSRGERREDVMWLKVAQSRFHDQFHVSPEDCVEMLKRPDHYYHQLLRSNYNWIQTISIYVYHHLLKFL